MIFHLRRGLCCFCMAVGFFVIAVAESQIADWYAAIAVVVTCMLFYSFSFSPITKRRLSLKIISVCWSVYTYLIVTMSGAINIGAHAPHGVPGWMQSTAPFVYGLVPLVLLWGMRLAFPTQE